VSRATQPVALVTGSTRGIGRGIALRLARDGFAVIINGVQPLDESRADKGAAEVIAAVKALGGEASFVRADVSRKADRDALLAHAKDRYGRLDLLVNNAGIEPPAVDVLEAPPERYERVMATNLAGPFFLTQQAAKLMIAMLRSGDIPKGRICFITSVQAYVVTGGVEYCMTKAALGMAAKGFANRLGEYDIPVIEISPGVIRSDMTEPHRKNIDRSIADGRLVTRRWGEPEDVARVVAAFARGDLDYSTGERIEVGGGLGMRRF